MKQQHKRRFFCLIIIGLILFSSIFYFFMSEDLNDVSVLREHFKKYYNNPQEFARWYNKMSPRNKNQILAGTFVLDYSKLTKIALDNGGDINTKVIVVNICGGYNPICSTPDYIYTEKITSSQKIKLSKAAKRIEREWDENHEDCFCPFTPFKWSIIKTFYLNKQMQKQPKNEQSL